MGIIQHEQIGSIADGTEHGVRTGTEGHPGQLSLARSHLHFVSVVIAFSAPPRETGVSSTTAQL